MLGNVGRSADSSGTNYAEDICKCWEECVRWSKGWHTFIYACEAEGVVSVPAIIRCNNLIYEYGSTNAHWHWMDGLEVPTCLFFVRGKKCPLVFIFGKKCPLVFRPLMVKALFA